MARKSPGKAAAKSVAKSVGKPAGGSPPASGSYRRIYAVVARIPRSRVATYGQVAALAGLPRHARLVGYALNVLPDDTDLPWHRVVNAKGQVSLRAGGLGYDQIQRQLLQREGVRFDGGTISLTRHQWRPGHLRSPVRTS